MIALRPGMTVALGDGVGAGGRLDGGTSVGALVSDAARAAGDVRAVVGWLPTGLDGLDPGAFRDVVALMPGWGARGLLRHANARFVPSSLAGIGALLRGPLKPDVLVTRLGRDRGFTSEVSWQRELVDAGVPVLAVLDETAPLASAEPPVARAQVIGHTTDGPDRVPHREPAPLHDALADQVLRFVEAGVRLQYGPGQLGTALLRRAQVPLHIDTGLLTDAVVDLDRRGLLAGTPSATYLVGTDALYDWADGRPILRGIDHTHDITRLGSGAPFVAVNTAIEIDLYGQVNVEGAGERVVGGIGGHPDFCAGARHSRGGLSIIAVPSSHQGRSPLVAQLSRPASTPAHDVDVVVTETGAADLRGADWDDRMRLIGKLFD